MNPTIGKISDGKALPIDVDRLIISRALIQANSGAGKSWAIRRLLEQTHGRVQHLVLDVEGEFYTLRERYDYVLAGRDGGDCPAEPRGAKLLALRLLELGVSAIIDIYELKAHERFSFVRQFLDALVNAPKKLWHPALIVIDEAHVFAPEKGKAESTSSVIDLMTRGRKRGFCGILATQRLSKLHKDAAAEANNKLIGRSSLDVDMKRAAEELGFTSKADQARLRTLRPGEFYAFGPAFSETVELVRVGRVQTTHPKAGRRGAPPVPPRAAVKRVLSELKDLPEQAREEARSIEDSRRRVRDLERELRQARAAAPPPSSKILERARSEGARDGERRLATFVGRTQARDQRVAAAIGESIVALEKAGSAMREPIDVELAPVAAHGDQKPKIRDQGGTRRTAACRRDISDIGWLQGPHRKILDAIAWLNWVRVEVPTKVQVAAVAGYAVNGGGFRNPLGRLRSEGLVEYQNGDGVVITEEGRALAREPDEPPTVEEMHRRVLETLPGNTHRRIMRAVLDAYPSDIGADELAEKVGMEPSGGGFRNPLGRLRTLGLIDYPARGQVVALPVLFLE